MIIRTYSELITLPTFEERFKYLKLHGSVGAETFGFDRVFNQKFYTSKEWRDFRHHIIVRDNGCDLAVPDYEIPSGTRIFIHHLNPITIDDIRDATEYLLNPEYVITTIHPTHNAIHYGDEKLLVRGLNERSRHDTCPWRK
jgi:hypothetical protein